MNDKAITAGEILIIMLVVIVIVCILILVYGTRISQGAVMPI